MISKARAFAGLLVLLIGGIPVLVRAQDAPGASGRAGVGVFNPISQLRQQLAGAGISAAGLSLEGPVDPETYILGPGDQLAVSIGGAIPLQLEAAVSADGSLVIPGVGAVPAAGQDLASVEARALAAVRQQYRNVPIDVALVRTRQFFVHVSGAIPEPSRYLTTSTSRVSDVLEKAYAAALPYAQAAAVPLGPNGQPLTQQPDVSSVASERPALAEAYQPSLRNVTLVRGGEQKSLDLVRYFTTGDTEHNPYVLDGDVIIVPAYHTERDAVLVTGEVAYPGRFAYRPGDTALDVLLLAVGRTGMDGLDEVRLIRRSDNPGAETVLLDVQAMRTGSMPAAPLQPGDHLNIPATGRPAAAIYGQVKYPGTYPIDAGETTLRELIDMAGGLLPEANLRAAYIERRKSFYFKGDGDASDLDFFSRAYLQRGLANNRIVINLEEALQPGAPDLVMQDGDAVLFPTDEGTVFVTGNVPQPGYVAFAPGQSAGYYIDQAGGPGPQTTGVYVFEAGTGQVVKGRGAEVHSGDTIFIDRQPIPENPEIAQLAITDATSRRQTRILTTQTIITGLSAITSIITAYVAITNLR